MTEKRSAGSRKPQDRGSAADILDRCRALEGGGLRTFSDATPLVLERAVGSWLEDIEGRRYLDLSGLFAVANTGHAHPKVVAAIAAQAQDLIHCPSAYPSRVRAEFLEAVASILPPELHSILPAMSGAMANEVAVSIARTRRPDGQVISFSGSYFGRSPGVVGLAGKSRYREALGLEAQAQFVPFPYPLHMGSDATDKVMSLLDTLTGPGGGVGKVAAIVLEPVQGNGGVVIPPPDFLPRLRAFCDRTGALMIADEIQSGCGRSGRMWATEHSGVIPDLMTIGKGIGGGMAVSAVVGRPELMRWAPDTYSSTFLTNNVNLAAAVAAIGVIRDEKLAERSALLGEKYLGIMRQRLNGVPGVAEVRGQGLWIAVELADGKGQPDAAAAGKIVQRLRDDGVVVGGGGYAGQVVKIQPPLNIDEGDLSAGIDKWTDAVLAIAGH